MEESSSIQAVCRGFVRETPLSKLPYKVQYLDFRYLKLLVMREMMLQFWPAHFFFDVRLAKEPTWWGSKTLEGLNKAGTKMVQHVFCWQILFQRNMFFFLKCYIYYTGVSKNSGKMDGLLWKTLLKWMILGGKPTNFRKHPYFYCTYSSNVPKVSVDPCGVYS